MAWIIDITPEQPVTAEVTTTGETRGPLWDAVEVGDCSALDLEVVVLSVSPPQPVIVGLCTGLQNDREDGWVSNRSVPTLNFPPMQAGSQTRRFRGLLRLVRWVVQPARESGTVTFYLRGVARKSC